MEKSKNLVQYEEAAQHLNSLLEAVHTHSEQELMDAYMKARFAELSITFKEAGETDIELIYIGELEAIIKLKRQVYGMRPARTIINYMPNDHLYVVRCTGEASRLQIETINMPNQGIQRDGVEFTDIRIVAYGSHTLNYSIEEKIQPYNIAAAAPIEVPGNDQSMLELARKYKNSSKVDHKEASRKLEIIEYYVMSENDIKGTPISEDE
jgi:hypothetical protein